MTSATDPTVGGTPEVSRPSSAMQPDLLETSGADLDTREVRRRLRDPLPVLTELARPLGQRLHLGVQVGTLAQGVAGARQACGDAGPRGLPRVPVRRR